MCVRVYVCLCIFHTIEHVSDWQAAWRRLFRMAGSVASPIQNGRQRGVANLQPFIWYKCTRALTIQNGRQSGDSNRSTRLP